MIDDPIKDLLHEIVNIRKSDNRARSMAKTILHAFSATETQSGAEPQASTVVASADLTKRETEVFSFLNMGMSRHEIAESLGVSLNTVKTHLNNIYAKLGVNNRIDAYHAFNGD
jgi:DNA-binding NarL/FixJ family response regulator